MFKACGRVCLVGFFLFSASQALADFGSPALNISNSGWPSLYPKIAGTDGSPNIFAIWMERVSAETQLLYFSKSADSGVTWSAPSALTAQGQIESLYPTFAISICVVEPYVHVVFNWRADDTGDWEIWYGRSSDNGETWPLWTKLTYNSTSSLYPDVEARGSYVHVTYQDDWPGAPEVMYKRIANYGEGLVDQTRRLTFAGGVGCHFPRIAVSSSGASVNIVYEGWYNNNWNLFYKHIYSSGAGGYDTRQLTFGSEGNGVPDIATSLGTDDQYVYIVYAALWPGNADIIYKRLDNFGAAGFNTYTARLTYSTTESWYPTVDFDGAYNNIRVAYHDNWPGNNDVMVRNLTNYGGAGYTGQRVSWGTGDSSYPTVITSGFWAYVIWSDDTSGNYEIYLKFGN